MSDPGGPHENLHLHLASRITGLRGPWVRQKDDYEAVLCQALEVELSRTRYWDALWNDTCLEFKKGRSIWLDLVRYGEIAIGLNEDAKRHTTTLFFVPSRANPDEIETIHCVPTHAIIERMGLDLKTWALIALLPGKLPRSLNAQASLTLADVARIATFSVKR